MHLSSNRDFKIRGREDQDGNGSGRGNLFYSDCRNTNDQIRILFFTISHLSVVFYISIDKNENLINIPINITKNKVDWNSYRGKTSAKYSRSRYQG